MQTRKEGRRALRRSVNLDGGGGGGIWLTTLKCGKFYQDTTGRDSNCFEGGTIVEGIGSQDHQRGVCTGKKKKHWQRKESLKNRPGVQRKFPRRR